MLLSRDGDCLLRIVRASPRACRRPKPLDLYRTPARGSRPRERLYPCLAQESLRRHRFCLTLVMLGGVSVYMIPIDILPVFKSPAVQV